MPRLTDAQRQERLQGLGASDVAVIAGVSPHKTMWDLYLEKIGELDPDARLGEGQRDRMERGHRLEDVALDWDAELQGKPIERIRRTIWHPRLPFLFVHPDARRKPWRTTRRLVEAKTSARRWDEVPRHVEAQVQMQMAATGAAAVDVVVLGFDGPPVPYEVERNDELIAALEDLAASFWDRVQRRDPPPIDGSRSASRYLDRMFREGPEFEADADQSRVLGRLLEIRATVDQLGREDDELVNLLKFSMAGAMRLFAPGVGRVLWTAPTERRSVAWKEVAAAYRRLLEAQVEHVDLEPEMQAIAGTLRPEQLDAIEGLHTSVSANVRQFRPTPLKVQQEVA